MAALDYFSLAWLVYLDSLTFVYLDSPKLAKRVARKGSPSKRSEASGASGASVLEFPKKVQNFFKPRANKSLRIS